MSDSEALVVLCSCCGEEEAGRIARALVERRLSACASIVPGIQSIYRWQGQVERASECLLLIKTVRGAFDELRAAILELHSYEVPEVIALPVVTGYESYLRWVAENSEISPKG